jgi:hypothetical protein
MPKHSSVVDHPSRAAIERDLAVGVPIRQMAKKYGLSIDTLYRFRGKLPPQLRASHLAQKLKGNVDLEKLRIDESEGILTNLAQQRARLLLVQDAALESGDRREVAYIADVIHRNVKLTGVYLGEFARHQVQTNVSVLVMPQYLDMRAALMKALMPFPAARKAVADALHRVEEAAAATPSPTVIEGTVVEVSASA